MCDFDSDLNLNSIRTGFLKSMSRMKLNRVHSGKECIHKYFKHRLDLSWYSFVFVDTVSDVDLEQYKSHSPSVESL